MSKNHLTLKDASNFLTQMKPQMELALPKHLNADRMTRLALTVFSTNPNMQNCSMQSIASSIMVAAQLGLEPNVNGQGYLIPYKETCTFVPGWKGLVDLVSRSGRGTVYTGVIYADQKYTFIDGARRDLIIHNETELDDEADITHAYAIGWVKDSDIPVIELWSMSRILKHRDKYNKVGRRHYSYDNLEMYARKVPLLQVLKYMPCSIELQNAIQISNTAEQGQSSSIIDGVVVPEPVRAEQQESVTGEVMQPVSQEDGYPEDRIKRNWNTWTDYILNKGKSPDEIIQFAEANMNKKMSEEQKTRIRNIKPLE